MATSPRRILLPSVFFPRGTLARVCVVLHTGRRETGNSVVFSKITPAPPGLVIFPREFSMSGSVKCDEVTF